MIREKISKEYFNSGYQLKLFDNLEIELDETKITSVVAPFKTGKSTLLKIFAGIEPNDGEQAKIVNSFYVPSVPSSFPWMNGKQLLKYSDSKIDNDKSMSILELVGLEGYEEHYPNNKSLGFRFRLVLAAAIAKNAKLLLLDEPFLHMDYRTKLEMYQLILDINAKYGIGILLATANLGEAILFSEKVILLKNTPHVSTETFVLEKLKTSLEARINSSEYSENLSKLISAVNQITSQKLYTISI